jgi:hypothetical protein
MSHPSELWTWERCKNKIKTLPGKNGFPDEPILSFLGFNLDTKKGEILDTLSGEIIKPSSITYKSVSHIIFYVLFAYSDANDIIPTGKPISSKQMRGNHYVCRGYTGETIQLVNHFASEPDKLIQVADVSVKLNVLPRVPIIIVLSLPDEEFSAEARIYFDETIESYLDSEQTYFLVNLMVKRLTEMVS